MKMRRKRESNLRILLRPSQVALYLFFQPKKRCWRVDKLIKIISQVALYEWECLVR